MSNNLQYRRTHKEIIRAFIKLARNRSFESITVQDILDEALVSRYTFYKHFKDKYEIAEILQQWLLDNFKHTKEQIDSGYKEGTMKPAMQDQLWVSSAKEHQEVFQAVWNIHTDTVELQRFFREIFREIYLNDRDYYTDSPNRELVADICADMQLTLMDYYTTEAHLTSENFGQIMKEAVIDSCVYMAKLWPPEKARDTIKKFV